MKKILIPLLLLLALTFTSFSQQGKLKIGSYTIYDSSGVLVISGGTLKVNANGWINPKDLNSTVGGLGLSLNPTLGLRLNTGKGITVGSNDTMVTTQELSLAEVDSIAINGVMLRGSSGKITSDSLSANYLVNFIEDGGTIKWGNTTTTISYSAGLDNFMKFNVPSANTIIFQIDNSPMLTVETGAISSNEPALNFTAGASISIGTTDNFDVALKRNSADYLTLDANNLIINGGTPLKFADGSVFLGTDGLTMASLLGIPNGTSATHTGWLKMKDDSNNTIYVPYWR